MVSGDRREEVGVCIGKVCWVFRRAGDDAMLIKVTLGEPICHDVGFRDKEIEIPVHDSNHPITFNEVADFIGLSLADFEGTLLITVNGKLLSGKASNDLRLRSGDHVELYMMLTGG